ncbi:MAG: hypothetical protein J5527_10450 [Treponema sp.]|nr:hypothetical protein [Treponema sp.]
MIKIEIRKDQKGNFIRYGSGIPFCFLGTFTYEEGKKEAFFPIQLGRYGENFDTIKNEFDFTPEFETYLEKIYEDLKPSNVEKWRKRVSEMYNNQTKKSELFNNLFKHINNRVPISKSLPGNSNPQKPLQYLREDGLCIITERDGTPSYRLIEGIITKGFESETIPPKLKKKVLDVFYHIDAVSGTKASEKILIAEHKFPEERWGDRKSNPDVNLSDSEIKEKFQLFTDQFNKIKREACKKCVATGIRQSPFGINFFYQGDEKWNCSVEKGPKAEEGCIGCGWYDMVKWKEELIKCAKKGQEM